MIRKGLDFALGTLSEAEAAELGSELETVSPERLDVFADRSRSSADPLRAALGRFASTLAKAKRLRLRGDIRGASVYERDANAIYEKLPKNARW